MQSDAAATAVQANVASEYLADTNFGRVIRLIFVADHPKGYHVGRIIKRAGLQFEEAISWSIKRSICLGFADHQPFAKMMLSDGAADRSREQSGLQRRDAEISGVLHSPGFLVSLNQQTQRSICKSIAGGRSSARAPLRQVEWNP